MTLRYCGHVATGLQKDEYLMNSDSPVAAIVFACANSFFDIFFLDWRNDAVHDIPQNRTVPSPATTRREPDSGRRELAGAGVSFCRRRAALHRARQGIAHLGRRRERVHRLHRIVGTADPGSRRTRRARCDCRRSLQWHELRSFHPFGSGSGGAGAGGFSEHTESPLRQFRGRKRPCRPFPTGAGLHEAQIHCEV